MDIEINILKTYSFNVKINFNFSNYLINTTVPFLNTIFPV